MAITKTRSKIFSLFEAEERWLIDQAESGWRLIDYSYNEVLGNRYTFEVDLSAKEMRYKVDFRTLKNNEEFEEYKELFHEAGWTIIAKSYHYQKFIFISEEANGNFSDTTFLIERERNRRKFVNLYAISLGLAILLLVLLVKDYHWLISPTIILSIVLLQQVLKILKCNQAIKKYNHH